MSDPDAALSFHVTGRVQGVWFRAWTKREAEGLRLSGWVRNEADGAVSGYLEGPAEMVEEMVRRLQVGPDLARVDGVVTAHAEPLGLSGFEVRR